MAGYIPRRPSSHLTRQGGCALPQLENVGVALGFLAPDRWHIRALFPSRWGTDWGTMRGARTNNNNYINNIS